MLERKIYRELMEWKGREHRCLVVIGQRQVGKTFIIDAFARREYEHHVRMDLLKDPESKQMFENDIEPSELMRKLKLRFGSKIVEGSTLLFIDEIQESDWAYSSLKQFSIHGKIDVIASGSLLDMVPFSGNNRDTETGRPLVPVGYVEFLYMYPLDFEEYLWAHNISKDISAELRANIRERKALDQFTFQRLSQLFREFMIVGGMPRAVDAFIREDKFGPVDTILRDIFTMSMKDINRYNTGADILKTSECYMSIPFQLSESNKKYMYSRINDKPSRKSSERYMENLLWIKMAGYGNFCYSLKQLSLPLKGNMMGRSFKIYLSDTGILLELYGNKAKSAIYEGDYSYNMGAIAENVVIDNIRKCGYEPAYYRKDKGADKMELDVVLEFWDGIAAIEVKSGKDRDAPSLRKTLGLPNVARRIMFENGNISVDGDGIEHYPLFASAFMDEIDIKPKGSPFS